MHECHASFWIASINSSGDYYHMYVCQVALIHCKCVVFINDHEPKPYSFYGKVPLHPYSVEVSP